VVTTEVDQLEQQQVLQSQAVEVQQDLHLPQRLSVVGAPVRVGSAALGVMVRRDLDFTVICADLGTAVQEAVAGLGAGLSLHPRVRQVQLRNDTGAWNTDPTGSTSGCSTAPSRTRTGPLTCGSSTNRTASQTWRTCRTCYPRSPPPGEPPSWRSSRRAAASPSTGPKPVATTSTEPCSSTTYARPNSSTSGCTTSADRKRQLAPAPFGPHGVAQRPVLVRLPFEKV